MIDEDRERVCVLCRPLPLEQIRQDAQQWRRSCRPRPWWRRNLADLAAAALVGLITLAMWLTVALLVFWLVAVAAFAAPGPTGLKAKVLTAKMVAGKRVMVWGAVPCQAEFKPDGDYECVFAGVRYAGGWRVDPVDHTLWITESSNPGDAKAWAFYQFRLDPETLTGPCLSPNCDGITLKLEAVRK